MVYPVPWNFCLIGLVNPNETKRTDIVNFIIKISLAVRKNMI